MKLLNELTKMATAEQLQLSENQKRAMELYSEGLTAEEIADRLYVSNRTVEDWFANLRRKLDCRTTAQVLAELMRNNVIQ